MNTIKAKELTAEQKQIFWDYFYMASFVDDRAGPNPWGAPWIWCPEELLEFAPQSESNKEHPLESMANIWYEKIKNKIFSEIKV